MTPEVGVSAVGEPSSESVPAQRRLRRRAPGVDDIQERMRSLERRFQEAAEELRDLRIDILPEPRAEISEIKDEWHGVHYRWWIVTLSGVLGLFVLSYGLYTQFGWAADHRVLPTGSDWLLNHLPVMNVLPVLSWGWLGLHVFAGAAAIAYHPRRMPFLIFLLSLFIAIRSVFVFLSPIGAPAGMVDMRQFDFLFSRIMGTYTFTNEFVFSGHTGIPFLFYLFFESFRLRVVMLLGSLTMGVCVLLSRNHYTVDVLGAFFVSYAIFVLAERLYQGYIRPLFQILPSRQRH